MHIGKINFISVHDILNNSVIINLDDVVCVEVEEKQGVNFTVFTFRSGKTVESITSIDEVRKTIEKSFIIRY